MPIPTISNLQTRPADWLFWIIYPANNSVSDVVVPSRCKSVSPPAHSCDWGLGPISSSHHLSKFLSPQQHHLLQQVPVLRNASGRPYFKWVNVPDAFHSRRRRGNAFPWVSSFPENTRDPSTVGEGTDMLLFGGWEYPLQHLKNTFLLSLTIKFPLLAIYGIILGGLDHSHSPLFLLSVCPFPPSLYFLPRPSAKNA